MKLTFINYWDVWGNEHDGWEVNDVSRHLLTGNPPENSEETLTLLIENDIVHSDTSLDDIEIELSEYSVEITERKNQRPFGRIEWETSK